MVLFPINLYYEININSPTENLGLMRQSIFELKQLSHAMSLYSTVDFSCFS